MSIKDFRELFGVWEFGVIDSDGRERGVEIHIMDVLLGIAGAVVIWAMV
jgi:hypothetical protein